jgi:hypothetical protein
LFGELNPEVNYLPPAADGARHPSKRVSDQEYRTLRVKVKKQAATFTAIQRGKGFSCVEDRSQQCVFLSVHASVTDTTKSMNDLPMLNPC